MQNNNSTASKIATSKPAAQKSTIAQKPTAAQKSTAPIPEEHSKNLLILGILSVSIALVTTTVSLVLYHNSGDIYLDRSRPGFLPDEEEVENQPSSTYTFDSSGPITEEVLNEYIDNFEEAVNAIDDLEKPFSAEPLSDESIGIPSAAPVAEP